MDARIVGWKIDRERMQYVVDRLTVQLMLCSYV
jgi:hypothetical protein